MSYHRLKRSRPNPRRKNAVTMKAEEAAQLSRARANVVLRVGCSSASTEGVWPLCRSTRP